MKREKGLQMPEPMVCVKTLIQTYGLQKSFWSEAKVTMGLPHYKIGRAIKFRLSEVERWMQQRKVTG